MAEEEHEICEKRLVKIVEFGIRSTFVIKGWRTLLADE
jgi:hypothetical protein